MRILSWNINGLRAAVRKGFLTWIETTHADVVAVQEIRARPDQLPANVVSPEGWHVALTPAQRPGYSGVGLFSRHPIDSVETSLGVDAFDREGRLQIVRTGGVVVVNVYFPHGAGTQLPGGKRSNDRIPFKLKFYRRLWAQLEELKDGPEPVLVLGDFNTAHRMVDLARPKQNKKTTGFTPSERRELTRWFSSGWVDTFRSVHPREPGHYTWWPTRSDCRERNVGWRIDYVLANPVAAERLEDAFIWPHAMGSDHCPLGVDLSEPR